MHYVYIIYSKAHDRYYIGETIDIPGRLMQHNTSHYARSSTSFTTDWKCMLELVVQSRTQALTIEKYLKSMKSKVYIQRLITDIESLRIFKQKVLEKFSITIL
jgi:putative endonuclease